ncbi:M48 family metalloprotease [Actinoplanes xinjiangensis]|uniref:M48 family metalloprotease n=1 Tax=Actinoplanes xinjiangensis TaxID=512350 RepID=UPI00342ED7C3
MTGHPADLRRAAGDPSVLPTTLSARFLVLFVLILAATASIWGYLGVRLGRPGEARVADCLAGTGFSELSAYQPGAPAGLIGDTVPVIACVAPDMGLIVWSSLAGPVALVICALAAYTLATGRRLRHRRGRFQPLDRYDPAAAAEIDELAVDYRLTQPPVVLVAPLGLDSFVFGTGRRPHLCIAGRVVKERAGDPVRFTGTVLHELAHLKNRDTGPTLLLSTAWRSFLALAVTPYLALLIADLAGLLPRATVFWHDDLHTVLAIAVMLALVTLTRLAVLRDRELTADATAGRHPRGSVMEPFLKRSPADRRRLPVLLRTHPGTAQRLRVAAEPWTLPPLSPAQLFGAGLGLAVLCQDAGTLAWQGLLAAGFEPKISPWTTFVLIAAVALATAGPIGALAWLVDATAWQRRLAAAGPPVATLALGLGAGMLAGEPVAVSAANASRWGVFDGVGDGSAGPAVVSALALVGILAALSRWSWDNAGAWLPTVRGSLRRVSRRSAAIGTVAVLPWYATWWAMHDTPLHGRLYLWTPGFADALTLTYTPLPGGEWLRIVFLPWDMLAWTPGIVVLTLLPVLVTTAGLLRSRTRRTPDWLGGGDVEPVLRPPDRRPSLGRAVVIGAAGAAVLLVVGSALSMVAHVTISDVYRENRDHLTGLLHYLLATATLLTTAIGALAAAVTTASHRSRSVALGLVSALVVACAGALATPALIGVAACGLPAEPGCLGADPFAGYLVVLGMTGTALPVKAIVAGMIVAGLAATAPRRPPIDERQPVGRAMTVLISSGATAVVAVTSAASWLMSQ